MYYERECYSHCGIPFPSLAPIFSFSNIVARLARLLHGIPKFWSHFDHKRTLALGKPQVCLSSLHNLAIIRLLTDFTSVRITEFDLNYSLGLGDGYRLTTDLRTSSPVWPLQLPTCVTNTGTYISTQKQWMFTTVAVNITSLLSHHTSPSSLHLHYRSGKMQKWIYVSLVKIAKGQVSS